MESMCFDIVNSQWYITHEPFSDPLKEKAWVEGFLDRWGLATGQPVDGGLQDRLAELRRTLTACFEEVVSGRPLSAQHMEKINRCLAPGLQYDALFTASGGYALGRIPAKPGWDYVISRIVYSFAELIAHHELKRIKQCGNPACRWVFYDESKNSTRLWCDGTCASLMKVRRFRSRKKEVKG